MISIYDTKSREILFDQGKFSGLLSADNNPALGACYWALGTDMLVFLCGFSVSAVI